MRTRRASVRDATFFTIIWFETEDSGHRVANCHPQRLKRRHGLFISSEMAFAKDQFAFLEQIRAGTLKPPSWCG